MTQKTEIEVSAGPAVEHQGQTSRATANPSRCECQPNACSHDIDSRHFSSAARRQGSSTSSEGKDTAAYQFLISAGDQNDGEYDKSPLHYFLREGTGTHSRPHLHGPIARLYQSSSELLRVLLRLNTDNVNVTNHRAKTDSGHQRSFVECGQCQKMKINCTPATKDLQGRCIACIGSKTRCTYPVDNIATSHIVGASQAKEHPTSTNLGKTWYTAPAEASRVFRELRRVYYSFVLWGDGHDILEGRLDDHLDQSVRLRSDVISLLRSIGKKLTRGCLHDNLAHEDVAKHVAQLDDALEETSFGVALDEEDSSDSEDETLVRNGSHHHSAEDLNDLIEDLDTDVQCLVELSPALQSPAREGGGELVAIANAGVNPTITEHRPFTELIRSTFPKADLDLAERLGQLNWERWLRLQEQRRSNEEEGYHEILQLDAETVAPSSKFHDSGVGASLPATTSYAPSLTANIAPSVISSILEGNRPTMPPLPKSAERGDPFTCPACSRLVRVSTKELWKKHLMSDLKPYVCVFSGCRLSFSPTLGLSDSFWIDHLKSEHHHKPGGWGCPLCFKQVGSNARRFCAHISRHMEDIAMATLPKDCESEDNSTIGDELTSHGGKENDSEYDHTEHAAAGSFSRSLLLYNLGDEYNEKEFNKLFEGIKNAADVRIMTNSDGTSKGFGYADFLDETSAQRAFADLKMRSIFGKQVGVEFVVPTEEFRKFEARVQAVPIESIAGKSTSDDTPRPIRRAGPEQQRFPVKPAEANSPKPEMGIIYNPVLQGWDGDKEAFLSAKESENSPQAALEVENKSMMEENPDAGPELEVMHNFLTVLVQHPQKISSDTVTATAIPERESLISEKVLRQLNLLSDLNQENAINLDWRFPNTQAAKPYNTRFKLVPDAQIRSDLALGRNAYEKLDENFCSNHECPLPTDSLFLGNLAHETSEEQLRLLFTDVENVIDAWTVVDNETSLCKGFGYARFADSASAQSALLSLHGKKVNGRALRVDYTRSGTRRPEKIFRSNNSQGHENGPGIQADAQRLTFRHDPEVFEEDDQIKLESIERENEQETQDPIDLEQRAQVQATRDVNDRSMQVLFRARSLYEYNIGPTLRESGFPHLTYVAGELFDVLGQKKELWLAVRDDGSAEVGWIWKKHFARLSEKNAELPMANSEDQDPNLQTVSEGGEDTKLLDEDESKDYISDTMIESEIYPCPFCSTSFKQHHNLKSHLLTHTQEKPYVCISCQARFRRLQDLKRHTRIHTGERRNREDNRSEGKASINSINFPSDEPEPWARSPTYDSTQESPDLPSPGQGEPYACAYCEVRFQRRQELKHHSKMHISER
ncbi:MAG: hypothetical protein M1822_009690 [Bathelium mastoideum]|nr:MAG: hypothetical protein M1822_009690 [Bathelium mastoideum]